MSPTEPSQPRRRAPRNSLSADLIVDRALDLMDARGPSAFSMRALAEDLGVGTMALYTYFRGKDEIFHAARDRVLAAYRAPWTEGCWDRQLRDVCHAMYELLIGRPAVLQLLVEGKPEGDFADAASGTMEQILMLLRQSGLDRAESARAADTLLRFTIGSALREVRECHGSGQAEGLRRRFAALSPDLHPTVIDLATELGAVREDGPGQYVFGLDLILSGLRGLAGAKADTRKPDAGMAGAGKADVAKADTAKGNGDAAGGPVGAEH